MFAVFFPDRLSAPREQEAHSCSTIHVAVIQQTAVAVNFITISQPWRTVGFKGSDLFANNQYTAICFSLTTQCYRLWGFALRTDLSCSADQILLWVPRGPAPNPPPDKCKVRAQAALGQHHHTCTKTFHVIRFGFVSLLNKDNRRVRRSDPYRIICGPASILPTTEPDSVQSYAPKSIWPGVCINKQ